MWYFFVYPFPKLCPVTLPYIQDGCHGLWSIEKLEIFENLLLYNHSMEWNQILSNLKKNKWLILFSCLHMTSEIQDIPEAYIHLIHTKQYYTLQYAVNLQSLELGLVEHYWWLELIWKSRQFSLYFQVKKTHFARTPIPQTVELNKWSRQ